jgi:L-ascorbate metabolism protein UlaG (beta-lactamase superfamily)
MIETEETRIYIDPFDLPTNYSDYPADAILITHEHGDHYDPTSIDIISDENTSFYFPAIMITEAFQYGATSVRPEDTFAINNINVRCFYMYTEPGHPLENNYTSYIIDIGGFTLFHAGDSWKIDEYEQLTDEIDLVLLPIGPGCQTMTGVDVVGVIATIDPSYFIPIHYTVDGKESFIAQYQISVENAGCELIDLEYYASYYFDQPESTDDTSSSTTTENGSNAPGFSLIAAISAGAYLLIRRTKKQKDK